MDISMDIHIHGKPEKISQIRRLEAVVVAWSWW